MHSRDTIESGKQPQDMAIPRVLHLKESLGRMLFLKIALLLCFAVVALRLVDIQVLKASRYRALAQRQYEQREPLVASRGTISDRDGNILVSNTMCMAYAADPKRLGDKCEAVAEQFARLFNRPSSLYRARLSESNTHFVYLERHVLPQTAKRIKPGDSEGLIELREPLRLYNYGHVAGQLLGFTNVDNVGLSGIELECDRELRGTDGYVIMQRDNQGRTRPSVDYPRVDPVSGNNVVLTLDIGYQAVAEEELRKGVERNKADGGLVVMIDPATGEILALASNPPMDPAEASNTEPAIMKNRPVTDSFEPGSVFKIVTAAAALERRLVQPGQKFFGENGLYLAKMPGGHPRRITDMHKFGWITFQEALEQSSNVVFAKVSDLVGDESLYTTARGFGFGTATGIEIPGEVDGELKKPGEWSAATLNSMAIGYEVAVTPIQLAAAYGAVANGGVLMKPYVVKRIVGSGGTILSESRPQQVRRVITEATATELTRLLVGVVERGTGVLAKTGGLAIAGKTGTSRRFFEGRYEPGNFTASFAGFFPADDPKVVCLVMLENPREGGYTGGLASAPIFGAIAKKISQMTGQFARPSSGVLVRREQRNVPDLRNLREAVARDLLQTQGFEVAVQGKGALVLGQSPSPGTRLAVGSTVTVRMNESGAAPPAGYTLVPDVRGLPMRRAINRLALQLLNVSVTGSGNVATQVPSPGQQVKQGTRVTLHCEPRAVVLAGLK